MRAAQFDKYYKREKCSNSLSQMTQVTNFLLYQIGWFACVLGAGYDRPWLGASIGISLVCAHMILTTDRPNQARLLLAALCVGVLVDTALLLFGVYKFPSGSIVDWLPPIWMTVLWVQFATTLRYSLQWLSGRYSLCALAALLGAPLAFLGGERVGAVVFLTPRFTNLLILAVLWAVFLPLILFISDRIHANAAGASYRRLSSLWRPRNTVQ